VLLARCANTGFADGLWNAPSGHLEAGEEVRAAMLGETREEIGLALAPDGVRVALVMQHRAPHGEPRVGWFFEAAADDGRQPVNAEPDTCSELRWFPLHALPDDMVGYCRAGLDAYRAGERFALHWHQPGDSIGYAPGGSDRLVVLPAVEPRRHGR
jgi:ADP-ribose pyrophosphatase YjhB (NUDIX family)